MVTMAQSTVFGVLCYLSYVNTHCFVPSSGILVGCVVGWRDHLWILSKSCMFEFLFCVDFLLLLVCLFAFLCVNLAVLSLFFCVHLSEKTCDSMLSLDLYTYIMWTSICRLCNWFAVRVCLCVCAHSHVCMYANVCVCVCVCVCMYGKESLLYSVYILSVYSQSILLSVDAKLYLFIDYLGIDLVACSQCL